MKKVALIGLGRWGKNILRELVNLGCEILVILHNHDLEKEKWLKENYPNVTFTYDKENIKNDPSLEYVVIATPMNTHFEVAKEFIEAGKKVFLEKPITNTVEDAESLINLVEGRQAYFMVGHIFLYHPCFIMLKNELEGKTVSKVLINKTSRSNEEISNKEFFLDAFIHEISILVKIFGKPTKSDFNIENNQMTLEFSNFIATITISKPEKDEKIRKFEFETSSGNFLWQNDELFDTSGFSIYKPEISPLNNELNIFLNDYDKWKLEIEENNKIAAESVKILSSLHT